MPDSAASPLEHAAVTVDSDTAAAFKALGHETRLAILLALWEAHEPEEGDGSLTFSELFARVGVDDSGKFNYHLEPLVGRYVAATDDGYRLRRAGFSVVQTVLGGGGIEDVVLEPRVIDIDCPYCGAPTAIGYEDENLYQLCTNCVGSLGDTEEGWTISASLDDYGGLLSLFHLSPNGVVQRDPERLLEVVVVRMVASILSALGGICPTCSGVIASEIDVCDDHDASSTAVCSTCHRRYRIRAIGQCQTCKELFGFPPGWSLVTHPAVVDFFHDHDIPVADMTDPTNLVHTFELVHHAQTAIRSRNPLQVDIAFSHAGESVRVTIDRHLSVIDVDEPA